MLISMSPTAAAGVKDTAIKEFGGDDAEESDPGEGAELPLEDA